MKRTPKSGKTVTLQAAHQDKRRERQGLVTFSLGGHQPAKAAMRDFSPARIIQTLKAGLAVEELDDLRRGLDLPMDRLVPMLGTPPVLFTYVTFGIEFDAALVEKIALAAMPGFWRDEPSPPYTKEIGDRWVQEARSAVLELPSVIVPSESNYLLNPAHADFGKLVTSPPEPFAFDPRLNASIP